MRAVPHPIASTSASSTAVALADDADADVDAGDEEIEIDDVVDAAPVATVVPSNAKPSATHVVPTFKPKTKKKTPLMIRA